TASSSTASWAGTCTSAGGTEAGDNTTSATCTFGSLTATETATATFTLNTFTVTANGAGNGSGGVSSSPTGISYSYSGSPTSGNALFNYGATVVLTATAATGSTVAWTGCDSTGGSTTAATCTLNNVTAARAATATFTLNTFTVTANGAGNGSGSVSSSPTGISYSYSGSAASGNALFNYGATVVLTASAATGSAASWQNTCTAAGGAEVNGATATCTFASLTGNKTVTVAFGLNQFTVTANATGNGLGSVSSTAGINYNYPAYSTGASTLLNYGTTNVVLTATATATKKTGSTVAWTGDCDSTGGSTTAATCTISTVNSGKTVLATFTYDATITIPKTPTGPKAVTTGTAYKYATGGSVVKTGDPVEYQFDWAGDGTNLSVYGSASQSKMWLSGSTYSVRARARSTLNHDLVSDWSGFLVVSPTDKAFIHVTSPNGGETWIVGTTHPITWDSNYLGNVTDPGTVYLYYSYAGAWHPITDSLTNPSAITCSGTSCSYNWVIPPMPATGTPTAGSPVPKNHMASTSVYVGNYVSGAWQCWDTSDKNFYILDNGWAFTISGADKGGAVLFFNADGSTFDGYGISLNKGMFRIPQDPQNQDEGLGTYTVAANGKINGAYQLADQLSDFSDNPSPDGSGSITGTLNANAKTMALTLKNQSTPPVTVFTMSGVWLSDLTMPENWSVQISGSAKGAISPGNPLKIETYTDLNDQPYADVFDINGSGTLPDGITPISITGDFFFTPAKSVYGFYELNINGSIEDGILSGTLNLSTGKFTFSLTTTSTNGKGHKYTFAGLKVATP
ncbi:MAG: hypothetical protein ACLQGU_00530, partial [bacterium]